MKHEDILEQCSVPLSGDFDQSQMTFENIEKLLNSGLQS